MSENNKVPSPPKKVLFLCHGYAVHAYRRIKIFADDPEFDVTVVSTYNYNFSNALNIHLKTPLYGQSQTDPSVSGTNVSGKRSMLALIKNIVSKLPFLLNVLLFKYDIFLFIKHLRILKKTIRSVKPDVIFLQTLLYPSYLSFFLPMKIPIIVTFWNGDLTWWAKWNGIDRFLKKKIVSYGIKKAAAITVNSQSAAEICYNYNIDKRKVNLIRYPGIDFQIFQNAGKTHARNKLGINAEKVVLCPRGYKIENDYLNNDIIIQAAKRIIKQDNKVLFLFLGIHINSEWENFYHHKENEPFKKSFRNDGSIKFDFMPIYYSAADVVVSISSNDSQPNCMLEAMACETPVIMGDIPQIREWISDGVNGFLVPCRDQNLLSQTLTEVMNMDDNRRSKITLKAYEQLKEKAEMNKNINLVKELVKSL